ncbi:MAG TPA: hypothetical protein VM433_14700 [Mycobacteriales bacterium]|nr:hypothetical protein [Mycobacteriales bacterium]
MKLFRRRPVPVAVRAVRVPAGDRRTGWALTRDGQPVVTTSQGLLLPGRELVPWAGIERVGWQRPVLTVLELPSGAAPVSGAGTTTTLHLADDDGGLPDLVHAGVTSSVAWSTHVRLQPAGGVRVVGRRRAGAERLVWQTVFDAGTDVHDPRVRAQADAVVARSQRTIG